MTVWIGEQGPNDRIHGDGFPFPANPYNRCLAEAALSYLPEGDPMEYAAAWPTSQRIQVFARSGAATAWSLSSLSPPCNQACNTNDSSS